MESLSEKIVCALMWFGVVVVIVVAFTTNVLGAEPPPDLWKGLIGEAVGEGYDGMYAVCCAYKNRLDAGLPLGCVALKRKDIDVFVKRQGQRYIDMAKQIVDVVFSGGIDVTNGATHYENIDVFGVPYWAKDMIITATIGSHTFYAKGGV